MSIRENLARVRATLPTHVTLVAVSKTKTPAEILEAYQRGQRIFGENKVQEMTEKWRQLPKDIQWHMIGHVQRNKVKYMAEFVSLIHGIDSLKLMEEVARQAARYRRTIDCLLQIRIAEEETKFGMTEGEATALLASEGWKVLESVRIVGVMGMATYTDDREKIVREFLHLKAVYERLKALKVACCEFSVVSMGMSSDYPIAVTCGSTMVRIGSSIFGERG